MRSSVLFGVGAMALAILAGCAAQSDGEAGVGRDGPVRPAIVSREAWGSAPGAFGPEDEHVPRKVLVHHAGVVWTGEADPAQAMRNLQAWGRREKAWPDVPYHFCIAPDGTIFEARDLRYRPDTNTSFDTAGYVNVEFFGNFDEQRVSEAQLNAAVELIAWLLHTRRLTPDDVLMHQDVAETACPGRDLARYLHDGPMRAWVASALTGEEPAVALLPALPDGPTVVVPGAIPGAVPGAGKSR